MMHSWLHCLVKLATREQKSYSSSLRDLRLDPDEEVCPFPLEPPKPVELGSGVCWGWDGADAGETSWDKSVENLHAPGLVKGGELYRPLVQFEFCLRNALLTASLASNTSHSCQNISRQSQGRAFPWRGSWRVLQRAIQLRFRLRRTCPWFELRRDDGQFHNFKRKAPALDPLLAQVMWFGCSWFQ